MVEEEVDVVREGVVDLVAKVVEVVVAVDLVKVVKVL